MEQKTNLMERELATDVDGVSKKDTQADKKQVVQEAEKEVASEKIKTGQEKKELQEEKIRTKVEGEAKKEIKQEERKETQAKKNEASVKATLSISKKHSIALCRFINNKTIDTALKDLQEVTVKKKAVRMRGEIPHRKNIGSGRYPIKASLAFIKLLRNLSANALQLGMDITTAGLHSKADGAGRRKSGRYRGKNTHLFIMLKQSPQNQTQNPTKANEIKK